MANKITDLSPVHSAALDLFVMLHGNLHLVPEGIKLENPDGGSWDLKEALEEFVTSVSDDD